MGTTIHKHNLQYKQLHQHHNHILGNISHIENIKTGIKYLMKIFKYQDSSKFQKKLQLLNKRKHLSSSSLTSNLLNILQIQTHRTLDTTNNQTFFIYIFMDFCQKDLATILQQKSKTQNIISQQQILYLLKAIIGALACAYTNGLTIPIISTKSILWSQNKQPKLITSQLIQQQHYYHQIFKLQKLPKDSYYFAPEILKQIYLKNKNIIFSPKTDIFAIGMMVLQLCSKKSLFQLYDYNKMIFMQKYAFDIIEKIPYSKGLQQLIRGMIQPKESIRFGLANLSEIITTQLSSKPKIRKNIRPNRKTSRVNIDITPLQSQKLNQNSFTNHKKYQSNQRQPLSNISLNLSRQKVPQKRKSISYKIGQYQSLKEETNMKIKNINYIRKIFSSGAVYQGQINQNGSFSGTGALYYPNGSICYRGSWEKNKFQGYGQLFNQNRQINDKVIIHFEDFSMNKSESLWIQYKGHFNLDRKNGLGTLLFRNGDKFEGSFDDNFIDGHGTYKKLGESKLIKGYWKKNKLICYQ